VENRRKAIAFFIFDRLVNFINGVGISVAAIIGEVTDADPEGSVEIVE